jgi:hypothetical protein
VVVLLKHVVLVGVIEHDSDFPICSLLAKEGASMRGDFLINEATTSDKELSVFISIEKAFYNKLLDLRIGIFANEILPDFTYRDDLIIFYQEVSKGLN